MATKMGRPLSENPRNNKMFIRLTDEENKRLEMCCEKTNKTKAEIARDGLNIITTQILESE